MSQSTASITTETNDSAGITWTLMRRVLILAVVLTALFSSLYYLTLSNQIEHQRSVSLLHDQQLLGLMVNQTDRQFDQLHKIITTSDFLKSALEFTDANKLADKIDKLWTTLQLDNQVSFTGFYGMDGSELAVWPQINSHKKQQLFNGWINIVKHSGNRMSQISCDQQCYRYFISPVKFNNKEIAYLIIAIQMSKTLNQFSNKSTKISGILSPSLNPATSTDILVFKWGYSANGNAIRVRQQEILQEFAKSLPLLKGQKQVLQSSLNQHYYELAVYSLSISDNNLLFVLDDISGQILQLQTSTIRFSLISFFIFLIFPPLLLVRLKNLNSAKEISTTQTTSGESIVPFTDIPEKALPSAQTQLDTQLTIEKANLEEHGLRLNHQLDQLKNYNEDVNMELARQMVNVRKERHFTDRILENSPSIILRLHKDGTIASINNFGEKIIGYSSVEITGKNFIDLYPDNAPFALNDLEQLSSITNGHQLQYEHEAHIKQKDGKECIILWTHTNLESENESDISILSTGLDITQRKLLEKHMGWLVNHDSLTSLFNRRRFEKELDQALIWAQKYKTDGCLLTLDLENFKDFNDSCGHKVGDLILRKVATTLKELTKQIDCSANSVTARLGGDEFAIILRNIDEEGALLLAQLISNALNNISHLKRQVSFQLSSSIGIATFSVADNNSTELLSNANYARNLAKIEGRNKIQMFQAEHSHLEQTHHRMIWRERIENALKNDRFILYFQPILNIQQNKISHYEVLIRMLDDDNDIISPKLFIHIAEKYGLIQQIDNFIIATAIKKQGELLQQGHDITLTINLSGKAFDDPELFNKIHQAIQINKANPEQLVFEITETSAVSNLIMAEEIMSKIKSLGCQFALDDFGIGFSSFQYLRELPVDYVKIDGSFVSDLANNSDNKVLVKALSEVAIGFNKLTVAEFVDSELTLDILKQTKVNFAQGYFIGKPGENIPVTIADIFYTEPSKSGPIH